MVALAAARSPGELRTLLASHSYPFS